MQTFVRIFTKTINFLYSFLLFQSSKLAFALAHYNVPIRYFNTIKRVGNRLHFKNTGNEILISEAVNYKQGIDIIITALNNKDIKVIADKNPGFTVSVKNSTSVNIYSLPNIVTLEEIFIEKLYNIYFPGSDYVVIDIGMNVGFASLYFASLEKVANVYGFEPFKGTYDEAVSNISLNPSLSKKITPCNYGISNVTGKVDVPMLESGSSIASTNESFISTVHADSTKSIQVEIRSIKDLLTEIHSNHAGNKIILKVDCEGEEYNIFRQIAEEKLLSLVSIPIMIIEWHIYGSKEIVDILEANDYTVLDLGRTDINSGLLYAFTQG